MRPLYFADQEERAAWMSAYLAAVRAGHAYESAGQYADDFVRAQRARAKP
jgi:hypothetical protein